MTKFDQTKGSFLPFLRSPRGFGIKYLKLFKSSVRVITKTDLNPAKLNKNGGSLPTTTFKIHISSYPARL